MSSIIMGIVAMMTFTSVIVASLMVKNIFETDRHDKLKRFLLLLLINSISYWGLVSSNHYSVDSFNLCYDMGPYWCMMLGRYFNCGTILWAIKFGLNQVVSQRIFMAAWILTLTVSVWIIEEAFCKLLNYKGLKGYIVAITVSFSFVNVFTMELMLFPEMAMVFIFSNLSIGILVYLAVSDRNWIVKWLLFIWFTFVALGSYQSYIGIIEAFVLVALFVKYNDEIKLRYLNSAIALVLGGIVSMANVLIVKVMIHLNLIADSGRGGTFEPSAILHNLIGIAQYQVAFWKNADGILPNGIMPVMAVLLIIVFGYYIHRLSTLEKKCYISVIVLGCWLLAFAAHVIEQNLLLRPRSNIAVWSVIAVVLLLGYSNLSNMKAARMMGCAVVVLLLTNIYIMQDMVENEASNNAIDKTEAGLIADRIVKYEENTGNYITNIATCQDASVTYYSSSSRYHNGELGGRIMATHYSNYRLIGYELGGRWVNRVEMDQDVYDEHFAGKDWTNLNLEEQLVFDGDTMYLAIY